MVAAALFIGASAMTVAAGAALLLAGGIAIVGAVLILAGPPLIAWLGTVLALALPLAAAAAVLTGALLAFGGGLAFVFSKNLGGATDKLLEFYNKWKLIISATVAFLTEGELTGALHDEFGAADSETQNTVKRFYLFFEKLKAGFLAMTDTVSTLLSDKAVPALQAIWREFMKLTDLLGITDSAYVKMGEAMNKSDWEAQGQLIGESLANAFLWIADTIVLALKLMYEVIEVMKTFWRFKFTIIGAAYGGFAGAAAGLIADAALIGHEYMDQKDLEKNGGKPVAAQDRINALAYELEAIKNRQGVNVAIPAATAASMQGEQQQRAYEALFQKFSKHHDTTKGYYTLENKLYLDGKLVYESMKNHAKDENDGSFAADGRNYSGEFE